MRTNHVLIDYESLQPELLPALNLPHFRVHVFVGANQTRLRTEFVVRMQALGERGRYHLISGAGRNALDFHIAFYLGELLAKDPDAVFHVIAVDKGYDPLLQHLKERKVLARRFASVADIPHVKAANAKTLQAKVDVVREALGERKTGRPTTVKTLVSTIEGMFPVGLDEGVPQGIVSGLERAGFITVEGTRVAYPDPPASAG